MGLRLIEGPAEEPVDLDTVKAQLGISDDGSDLIVSSLIAAARESVEGREGYLGGRMLMPQTWELVIDSFPTSEIELPFIPVQEVLSVSYDDADGAPQTVSSSSFYLDNASQSSWIMPIDAWPSTLAAANAVRVRFIAGYEDAAAVPAPIKASIVLIVKGLYQSIGAASSAASSSAATGIKRESILNGLIDVTYMTPQESTVSATTVTSMPPSAMALLERYRRMYV